MMDNLRRRNIVVMEWCCTCKNGESGYQLLLHCDLARDCWSLVLCLFGLMWVMPQKVIDLLVCWKGLFGRHQIGDIWDTIPLWLMWLFGEKTIAGLVKDLNELRQSFRCFSYILSMSGWLLLLAILFLIC